MKQKYNKQIHWLLARVINLFIIVVFLNLTVSCHYYKVTTVKDLNGNNTKEQLLKYQNLNKSFVLYSDGDYYHIVIIKVDAAKKSMEFKLDKSKLNSFLYDPFTKKNKRYRPNEGEGVVLNEVYVFTSGIIISNEKSITIPLSAISKIDIIKPNKGKTAGITIGVILGIPIFLAILWYEP